MEILNMNFVAILVVFVSGFYELWVLDLEDYFLFFTQVHFLWINHIIILSIFIVLLILRFKFYWLFLT